MQAALTDDRIRRVALVNQLCYVWGASYSIQLSAWRATKAAVLNAALDDDAEAGESAKILNRLLPFARKFAKGSLSALMSLSAKASAATSANVVQDWFQALSARDVRTMMLFSEGDPGLVELERWLGPDGERATSLPGVEKRLLGNADHMLTQPQARVDLGSSLFELLGVEEKVEAEKLAA